MQRIVMLISIVISLSMIGRGQTFDAATVKRAPKPERGNFVAGGFGCRGVDRGQSAPQGRRRFSGLPLKYIIGFAYGLYPYQLTPMPEDWMNSELWTIEGVAPDPATA